MHHLKVTWREQLASFRAVRGSWITQREPNDVKHEEGLQAGIRTQDICAVSQQCYQFLKHAAQHELRRYGIKYDKVILTYSLTLVH